MSRRTEPDDHSDRTTPVEPSSTENSAPEKNSAKPTELESATENRTSTENIESTAPAASAGPDKPTGSEVASAPEVTATRAQPVTPAGSADQEASESPLGARATAGTTSTSGTAVGQTASTAEDRKPVAGVSTPAEAPVVVAATPGSLGKDTAAHSDDPARGIGTPIPVRSPGEAPDLSRYPTTPAAPARWHRVAYPPGVLPAAGITGLIAAATVPLDRPGIGWLLAGSATAAAVGVVHHRAGRTARPERNRSANRERLWWAITAAALLAVGTFRAAGWLFTICLVAAAVAGSLAVVGRRSERGLFRDALAVPLASAGAVAWAYTAAGKRSDGAGARNRRLGASAVVTMALLAVFVPLLAGADATFAALVDGLIPRMDVDTLTRWLVVFVPAAAGVLGALYLLAGPPNPADGQPKFANRTLARLEWGLPVGALTAVFAVFLGAQLVALFGGDDYVQRTAGLTYAEYARSGFWQLSTVTVLTLAVILPVLQRAARDTALDRLWLRGLLCTISGLTLVMIASALGRMWTYQQAYGFTVLRLLVETCELWLGIVYVLVIVAVLRLETVWLPRSAVATATAALLALAVLNPEGLVANQNIDRWERGEKLDTAYLSTLSVDIVPALDRLPAPIHDDVLHRLRYGLDEDTWNSWNLARTRAR